MDHRSEGKSPGVCRTVCVAAAIAGMPVLIEAQTRARSPAAAARTLTVEYCAACRNDQAKAAGVSFEGVDWPNQGASADILEEAVRKVSTAETLSDGGATGKCAALTNL